MNNHSIGFNVIGNAIQDENLLIQRLIRIKPRWMLVMNNYGLALKIANLGINTIYRHYPDNSLSDLGSVDDFINLRNNFQRHDKIWHYTTNEVGLSNEVAKWHVDLINNSDMKLVVLNHSVGTPAEN